MPQRKCAKKEMRKNAKRQHDNLKVKGQIKNSIKTLKKVALEKDAQKSQEALCKVYQILDKAAKKNLIHKNKASRKKSRLSKLLASTLTQKTE